MEDKEILDILKEIIKDSIDDDSFDPSKITLESIVFKDIVKNSISSMYVALAIEDRFGFEFDNETIKELKTVQDFIDYIKKNSAN